MEKNPNNWKITLQNYHKVLADLDISDKAYHDDLQTDLENAENNQVSYSDFKKVSEAILINQIEADEFHRIPAQRIINIMQELQEHYLEDDKKHVEELN